MAELHLKDLSPQRDPSLRFDLVVPSGGFIGLFGASGAGKTTLLHLIAGLEERGTGQVLIGGEDQTEWPAHRRGVTLLFQDHNLFEHMTVFANIALGITTGTPTPAEHVAVTRAIDQVGLTGLEDRLPHQLSGGQQGRVGLARCLMRRRGVLLLDEPFAALDPPLRYDMAHLLAALRQEHRMTVVVVSHDLAPLMAHADGAAPLQDGRLGAIMTWAQIAQDPRLASYGAGLTSQSAHFSAESPAMP
ncbi:MAG: ATP-binding cassette domain-containing protein [Pseudomonadota bacterium]